jgi:acetolactate synthase-1/2/3 large subunit
MADGLARVSGGLGVAFTSTGTAAGNAAGAMVEALTAGTALLHVTGQIETEYLDQDLAYIHEAPDQLSMLSSISKAAFRVRSVETALPTIREAVRVAQTAPSGPVSVEIPIDIQAAEIEWPADLAAPHVTTLTHCSQRVAQLAEQLVNAKRPLLWLGGRTPGRAGLWRRDERAGPWRAARRPSGDARRVQRACGGRELLQDLRRIGRRRFASARQ